MWASWAFCELVHISLPTPCLSIKQFNHGFVARGFLVFCFLAFCEFIDDQCTSTTGTGVHRIRRFVVKRLMRALGVVEHKILAQSDHQFAHRGIAVEVNILMLDVAPQAFYKNVVKGPASPVHADFYPL